MLSLKCNFSTAPGVSPTPPLDPLTMPCREVSARFLLRRCRPVPTPEEAVSHTTPDGIYCHTRGYLTSPNDVFHAPPFGIPAACLCRAIRYRCRLRPMVSHMLRLRVSSKKKAPCDAAGLLSMPRQGIICAASLEDRAHLLVAKLHLANHLHLADSLWSPPAFASVDLEGTGTLLDM